MSFVGKMLIVMQVLLSIVFMAFAAAVYTTQQNWKSQADNAQTTVDSLQSEVNDANTAKQRAVDDLTMKANTASQRAESAEGQNAQFKAQLANEQQKNNRLELELKSQTGLAMSKSDEASFRDEEAQRQRIAYQTLRDQLNEMAAELRTTEDHLFAENIEKEALAGRFNGLLAELGDLRKIIRLNNLDSDPAAYAALAEPPPPVDGLIVATKKDKTNRTEFVEVSIGSDDGLNKNHILDVFRSSAVGAGDTQYLGKIRIVYVTSDSAVGYVVEAAKNGIIERGDNVTTKL